MLQGQVRVQQRDGSRGSQAAEVQLILRLSLWRKQGLWASVKVVDIESVRMEGGFALMPDKGVHWQQGAAHGSSGTHW